MDTLTSLLASLVPKHSLSLLSLPTYHLLTLYPHALALLLARHTLPNSRWDNRNPRSTTLHAHIRSKLSAAEFAKWERMEACAANGFENFPIYAVAVALGHWAGLGRDRMDGFAVRVLLVRALYTWLYVYGADQVRAAGRSVMWVVQTGLCWGVVWEVARRVGEKGL